MKKTVLTLLFFIGIHTIHAQKAPIARSAPIGDGTYVWYQDLDKDGFGNPNKVKVSRIQPTGYVENDFDCNDLREDITRINWYIDNDKDGFGVHNAITNKTQCTDPSTSTVKYVLNSTDCNDSNALINPNTIWYLDNDKDSFGTNNTTTNKKQCADPSTSTIKYVLTSGDLNDASACITNISPQTWYLDGDKDNYGTAISSVSCSIDPSTPTVKYVLNNTDCDDAKPLINPSTRWYQDLDGDTYGNPAVFVAQCTQPAGYVANNLDGCPTVKGSFNGCLIPDANFSADQNYILTMTPKVPVTDMTAISQSKDVNINITYYDGLGRPVQQIAGAQSATGKDIVTHIEYDAYGRQTREYLPYASSNSSLLFDPLAQNNTLDYYKKPNYDNTTNPYSEKLLEASPLNRVLHQAAPGNDWKLGSTHEIKLDYQTNSTGEVRLFQATTTWNAAKGLYDIALTNLTGTVFYTAGELYKNITYDENTTTPSATNGTIEFKDKEGRVVLKRTFENNIAHDTYYVYDIYGNLTYVIPPLAAEKTSLTTAILDGLCYQYRYDHRNRLVEKKLPGKQWEFIVYDKLDRVVATGPAVSPFSNLSTSIGWLLTKYDAFNRPVLTAWWPPTTTTPATAVGRKTLQDSYNGSTAVLNETKIATATNTTVNGVAYRYSNVAYPPATTFHVLTVNYYDDYNFPAAPTLPASVEGQTVYYNNTIKPIGLPTGSWTRVPETSTLYKSERSYSLYDSKARPIRSYTTNHLGGYTYVDSKIDFAGKTLYTITRHKRLSTSTELKTREDFSYSDQDRLLTQSHQINSQAKELLANNSYNELGQLTSKKVGGLFPSSGGVPQAGWLQNINYSYNIRGWLTGINDINNLTDATTPPSGAGGLDLFGFKINYNTVENLLGYTGTPLYNGNIAETYWSTNNDGGVQRKYGYKYDNLNRLKQATYQKAGTVTNAYNESLTYDKNGNILSLNRNGTSETATAIDKLAYTYSHNQLLKVADTANKTQGFVDGTNTDNDFTYDFNGNMTIDKNKGITAITYNHLNLPIKITFGTTGNIVYVYNATGQKLKKVVTQGTAVTTTDYLDDYQYVNNTLQFFPTSEGYVAYSQTLNAYSYVYQYKDHLGNIRLSYSDANNDKLITNNEIVEESNYYPFGLKQTGYNNVTNSLGNSEALKRLYNGKELQGELGLNMYDYGARSYDATIGRWMNIDPLAEKMPFASPYAFCLNNPVNMFDPDGRYPYPVYIRSFIATGTVAGGTFRGDGRSASTDVSRNTTSRVTQSYIVDSQKGTVTGARTRSDATVAYAYPGGIGPNGIGLKVDQAKPTSSYSATNNKNSMGDNITTVSSNYTAKDPITPQLVTPQIDMHPIISISENSKTGTVSVSASIMGDSYPSTEAFMQDASGKNGIFIGVSMEQGGLLDLAGDNRNTLINTSFQITTDGKGNFTGVKQGDKTYTIGDWNKQFTKPQE
jgi:RHS repeat-associated protein